MSKKRKTILTIAILSFLFVFSNQINAQDKKTNRLIHKVEKKIKKWNNYFNKWNSPGKIKVDSIYVLKNKKEIRLFFNKELSYIPIREKIITEAKKSLKKEFGWWLRKYSIEIFSDNQNITELVPNKYRKTIPIDSTRFLISKPKKTPIISRFYTLNPDKGLLNSNLAIWHSHGRYYESKLDRWEWQRARIHSTVEDVFPMTFVLDYLEPMLENAGATVFIPRERDINRNEVIVDNDISTGKSYINLSETTVDTLPFGFKWKEVYYNNENPFKLGTYLKLNSNNNTIKYIPDIPESGEYAVYISYGKYGSENIEYTVNYAGGNKRYIINQNKGIGTWIYLGKFYFNHGINPQHGAVTISSKNPISTDAIRFGGGMGNIARRPSNEIAPNAWSLKNNTTSPDNLSASKSNSKVNPNDYTWKISKMPRYMEAARYYLQYSGMPDSIVYSLSNGKNDYNDDYKSRGEWVNYLMGNPNGPTGYNDIKGLQIPIDMALAFHTDAGVVPGDSIIGTLAIYNSEEPDKNFPSGLSKMVNRDLVDIMQTQIVDDIRELYNPKWSRRGIWNKAYSEAWRANTPMMLLELMSHQNLADISFGLNPAFRFDVARAIYKGILKFLAYQNNKKYVVQPLPIDHFNLKVLKGKKVRLSWSSVDDPIEPSAKATAYMIYQRKENQGFNQGVITKDTFFDVELDSYQSIFSFKITAINEGGESFPSEILSVGIKSDNSPLALVVNAFDRVSSPAVVDDDNISGIAYFKDMGVPYKHEIGLTGISYNFDRKTPWLDDDNPGWGASYSDWEGKIIAGNSFDYPLIHGTAIMNSGYSFTSTGDEVFSNTNFDISPYKFVDIIFGEERTEKSKYANKPTKYKVYNKSILKKIKEIANIGGNIFISGAYIGTDFIENNEKAIQKTVENILHYKWRTNFASKSGDVYTTDYVKPFFTGKWTFNTKISSNIYMVEAPDGIEPLGEDAITAFRYSDTEISAGVVYKGKYKVVALGFPFETINGTSEQNSLMKQIIKFFE